MSAKFEQIKYWYVTGMWNEDKVYNAVGKGWITASEYTNITNKPYDE